MFELLFYLLNKTRERRFLPNDVHQAQLLLQFFSSLWRRFRRTCISVTAKGLLARI